MTFLQEPNSVDDYIGSMCLDKADHYSSKVLRFLMHLIPNTGRALDIMAGTGSYASIKNHGFKGEAWANDQIQWGGALCEDVDYWTYYDAQKTGFSDGFFDIVLLNAPRGGLPSSLLSKNYYHSRTEVQSTMMDGITVTYRGLYGQDLPDSNLCGLSVDDFNYRKTMDNVLLEVHRILKSGGTFVFCNNIVKDMNLGFDNIYLARKLPSYFINEKSYKMSYVGNEEGKFSSNNVYFYVRTAIKGE